MKYQELLNEIFKFEINFGWDSMMGFFHNNNNKAQSDIISTKILIKLNFTIKAKDFSTMLCVHFTLFMASSIDFLSWGF